MDEDICGWPDCDRPPRAGRGLCQRDYMRARRAGRLDEFHAPLRRCRGCQVEFSTGSRESNVWCSRTCFWAAWHASRADDRRKRLAGRACDGCGSEIPLNARSDARFCSVPCQQAAWYVANDDRLRAAAGKWKATHRELANEYEHRRRAVLRGADAENIDWSAVWLRDRGVCWICEHPVDPTLRHPDRMRRSLDHVVPIAKGGSHTMNNVAIAHLRCNIAKRDKILDRLPPALTA